MNIGTGKPSRADLMILPHHGIDLLEPGIFFSVFQYLTVAVNGLRRAVAENRQAWFCGGTGLYIRAIVEGLPLGSPPRPALRARMTQLIAERGAREVASALGLSPVDPENPVRVLRAVENACSDSKQRQRIYTYGGLGDPEQAERDVEGSAAAGPESAASFELARRELAGWRCAGIAVLDPGRAELEALIDRRVSGMFDHGLVDETSKLRQLGYGNVEVVRSGIGYREAGAVLDQSMTREEAVKQAVLRTRQYAKRQRTYFRGRGWPVFSPDGLDAWAGGLSEG